MNLKLMRSTGRDESGFTPVVVLSLPMDITKSLIEERGSGKDRGYWGNSFSPV